uniref:Uncharacterized protein n=1 Tax=Rhizophora mucronata TaxID=61149 RepID=A0A2P2QEC0_RHIMU
MIFARHNRPRTCSLCLIQI